MPRSKNFTKSSGHIWGHLWWAGGPNPKLMMTLKKLAPAPPLLKSSSKFAQNGLFAGPNSFSGSCGQMLVVDYIHKTELRKFKPIPVDFPEVSDKVRAAQNTNLEY